VAQRAAVRFQCTASLAADPLRPSAGRAAPPASRPLTSRCRDVGPASGSLGPRQPLPARLAPGTQRMLAHTLESGARLRTRLTGGNPHRQGHPHPRLFKARTSRQPETPSAGEGPRPCDRGGRPPANVSACEPSPGTLSRVAMGPAAVRGGGSPPHATPPYPSALRRPYSRRGRCSSPTSATDTRHVHLSDHSTPEVTASLSRCWSRPMELSPSGRLGSRRA
jgi:hypothetical protein